MLRLFYKAQRTFLFYDFETTGLNPVFDQVVRGAFIRTTTDFKEIARHEISVRLNPDVIPSPGALAVNRLSMDDLQQGDNEYEAMKKIHDLMNKPGTISVGYNSMGFDDLFLRFGFYRNLLQPYSHHSRNYCGRMDIYPMTVAYRLFRKNHLSWVMKDGTPSFKLESMNQANQLFSGPSHNAMADTETTLALTKRLHEDKAMWDFCTNLFDTDIDKKRIAQCATTLSVGHVNCKIGLMINHRSKGNTMTPVLLLGESQHYSNQTVWLRLDQTLNDDIETTKVLRKKIGEAPFFIPFNESMLNSLPTDVQSKFNASCEWIRKNPTWFSQTQAHFLANQYPQHDCDLSAQLYQLPFPTRAEEELFSQFHAAKLADKPAIAGQFPRAEHRELVIRLLGRHYPNWLSSRGDINIFNRHINAVFSADGANSPVDYKGDKQFSLPDAERDLKIQLKKSLDPQQQSIIDGYARWLERAAKPDNINKGIIVIPTLFQRKQQLRRDEAVPATSSPQPPTM